MRAVKTSIGHMRRNIRLKATVSSGVGNSGRNVKSLVRKFGIDNCAHQWITRALMGLATDNSFSVVFTGHVSLEDRAMTET